VGPTPPQVGKVATDAGLKVLADVMIDRGQYAAAPMIDIWQAKLSDLGQ
jgi:hypothetical protein